MAACIWIEYNTSSRPDSSGLYLRTNGVIVESLQYVAQGLFDGWWENDEGCLVDGTTHWAYLPELPDKT